MKTAVLSIQLGLTSKTISSKYFFLKTTFAIIPAFIDVVFCCMLQALAAWEYVGSVLCDMEERGDGGLQLEESAFQLLFAAVGLELLRDPQSATETVGVGRL